MSKTKSDIRTACETFLADWNRHDWMQENGEWASEAWNDEREEYQEAQKALEEALGQALEAVKKCREGDDVPAVFDAIGEAQTALEAAAKALDGQVRPDDSDYIAEGTIDPDCVESAAVACDVGAAWQGWDCKEGWHAHRVGTALYLRWWRDAYGNRHQRDLWVLVEEEFFEEEGADEEADAA